MKHTHAAIASALPGLILAGVCLCGQAPQIRDLPNFFVPLRERTATVLRGERSPWWNGDVGCGEPYFANPETGVGYPLNWLALLLKPEAAVGVEAGLSIAILAAGCALLAGRLGAKPWYALAAGWGVALAGPTIDAVGVINNLDTLAWLPWLWWAALGESWRWIAVFTALSLLGAEPQLAAIGAVIAGVLAPRRRTFAGIALGVGVVAVQVLPFLAWVRGGDRGVSGTTLNLSSGALGIRELPAILFPGVDLLPNADRFVNHLVLPMWILVLAGVALGKGVRATRVMAAAGWVLVVVAVMAGLPLGQDVWRVVTAGLVRYPSRLLYPAVICLAVAAAAAVEQFRIRIRKGVLASAISASIAVAGVGYLCGGALAVTLVQSGAAVFCLLFPTAAPIALVADLALSHQAVTALNLARVEKAETPLCLEAQKSARGRIYTLEISREQLIWVKGDEARRSHAMGWGYAGLRDGRRMVRTFAPVQSARLATHLALADRGPEGRWWLDALAADRIVSHRPLSFFPPVCSEGDFNVSDNLSAWPPVWVAATMPRVGERPSTRGTVKAETAGDAQRTWRVEVENGGGVLLWSETPDRGWRVFVDGRPSELVPGPGIIQGVALTAGSHHVEVRYRPQGLLLGGLISIISLGILLIAPWIRRSKLRFSNPPNSRKLPL